MRAVSESSNEQPAIGRPRHVVAGLPSYLPGKGAKQAEAEHGITNAIKLASNENPEAPLDPRWLHDAQRLLAQHVGPLAALLVRRAAAGAPTRQQFIARVADLAAEGVEREKVAAALCRLR